MAFEAARTWAQRTFLNRGDLARAQALFAEVPATSPEHLAQHEADLAACAALAGERGRAIAMATAAESRLEALGGGSATLRYTLAWALYTAGAVRRAEAAARRLTAAPGSLGFMPARYLVLVAGIALDRGALDELSAALEKVEPLIPPGSSDRLFTRFQAVMLRVFRGELEGAVEELDALTAAARAASRVGIAREAEAFAIRLRVTPWARLPITASHEPAAAEEIAPRRRWDDFVALARALSRVHAGLPAVPVALAEPDYPEVAALSALVQSAAGLSAGDGAGALAAAQTAVEVGREHGYGLIELEGRLRSLEAALVAGVPPEQHGGADELAAEAHRGRVAAGRPRRRSLRRRGRAGGDRRPPAGPDRRRPRRRARRRPPGAGDPRRRAAARSRSTPPWSRPPGAAPAASSSPCARSRARRPFPSASASASTRA